MYSKNINSTLVRMYPIQSHYFKFEVTIFHEYEKRKSFRYKTYKNAEKRFDRTVSQLELEIEKFQTMTLLQEPRKPNPQIKFQTIDDYLSKGGVIQKLKPRKLRK